jgi:5-methyltetrahydropteroyltriglutamate--homocysteine methyltransferase
LSKLGLQEKENSMAIPTEPVGSIPRPQELVDGVAANAAGDLSDEALAGLYDSAIQDTIHRFEETGSPVISDGEQTKPSFVTYPLSGAENLGADGVVIGFADGHDRQLPILVEGPFGYTTFAADYLTEAKKYASVPVKQAVIAASAMSLLYPADGLEGYSQEAFLDDLADGLHRGTAGMQARSFARTAADVCGYQQSGLVQLLRRGAHPDRYPHLSGW